MLILVEKAISTAVFDQLFSHSHDNIIEQCLTDEMIVSHYTTYTHHTETHRNMC